MATYLTTTVGIYSFDLLQRAVDAMIANFFQNPWANAAVHQDFVGHRMVIADHRTNIHADHC